MGDNNKMKEQCDASVDGNCIGNIRRGSENVARMVTERYAPEYNMKHRYRGQALIFGHENFKDDKLEKRIETVKDMANLKRSLQALDFDVRTYKDLSHKDIMRKIKHAACHDHNEHDCILVAIISHGENDLVYAADKSYKLDTIWSAFTADLCSTLAGKPKIFIVQASQGTSKDAGYKMKNIRRIETDGDSTSNYRIPIHADFLVAFCTMPGHVSWSSSVEGSWFIETLCKELDANGKQYDMLQLLTFVSQRVAINFETYEESYKQMPCTMSTMTRILRFGDKKRDRFSF